MNDEARRELADVVRTVGPQLADESRKLRSLLADRCPALRKEIHALAAAAECRVAADIRSSSTGLPWSATAGRFVTKLIDSTAMDEAAARWVVDSWGIALGKTANEQQQTPPIPLPPEPQYIFPSAINYVTSPPPTYVPTPPAPEPIEPKLSHFDVSGKLYLVKYTLWTIGLYIGLTALLRPTWALSGVWIAAQCGVPAAQRYFAELYETGRNGTNVDLAKAAMWRVLSYYHESSNVQREFADYYYSGKNGYPVNLSIARGLFRQSAEAGNLEAAFQYAYMCEKGEGGPVDKIEARQWYTRPAERGNPIAMYNLAILCENGEGGKCDLVAARQWYHKAADQDYAPAFFPLAQMLYEGEGGSRETEQAKSFFEKSMLLTEYECEEGDHSATCRLGIAFRDGKGKPINLKEAVRYFRLAADRGNVRALALLGECYLNGEGVTEDRFEAHRLFRQAADKGDSAGMRRLGFCYEHGYGVPKNREEAIRWYRKAVEAGDPDAQEDLDRLLK